MRKTNPVRKNASWRLERLGGKSALSRVIAPLACQKSRQKTMCIAIGPTKRLREVVKILNDLGVEV